MRGDVKQQISLQLRDLRSFITDQDGCLTETKACCLERSMLARMTDNSTEAIDVIVKRHLRTCIL